MSSRLEHNKQIVRSFINDAINRRAPERLAEVVHPEADKGLAEAAATLSILSSAFEVAARIEDLVASGDTVVCRYVIEGASGRRFIGKLDVFQIREGRIGRWSQTWDPSTQPGSSLSVEPILEVGDIQGNVLPGFNKPRQGFLFIAIESPKLARRWLHRVQPLLTSAAEVLAWRRLRAAMPDTRRPKGAEAAWINVAFSHSGLSKLHPGIGELSDEAFVAGLANRSPLLGDPTDREAEGSCENWVFGGPRRPTDLVVVIGGASAEEVERAVDRVRPRPEDGASLVFRQDAAALPARMEGREHFGFVDGISQPAVRGRVQGEPGGYLSKRVNPLNADEARPGQRLVWPGEFLVGYPGQDPRHETMPGPVSDAGTPWARNGSFLVVRRLRQNVGAFRRFLYRTAAELTRRPSTAHCTPEFLAAKLMGRWESGAPLSMAPHQDDPVLAGNSQENNNFHYAERDGATPAAGPGGPDIGMPPGQGDPLGLRCPHSAHIRAAYPRDDDLRGEPRAEVERHRLLRRGIPYGEPWGAAGERGLMFLAYQSSIARQFEFVQRRWLNDPELGGQIAGHDPIVGQRSGPDRLRAFYLPIRTDAGTVERLRLTLPEDFVSPTGGGYYFAPSIRACHELARPR